jgi:SAM-dependent methyltransferase
VPDLLEDQSRAYGRQFAGVYDVVFPAGDDAEQTAERLVALAGPPAPAVLELGVGSGRVAVPLARRGARVVGVDSSPELLALAAARAAREGVVVDLVEGDLRTYASPVPVDLTCCLCATLSMLATEQEQAVALALAAASTRPGGRVVVETHSPDRVRRMHAAQEQVTVRQDVAGLPGGLTLRSTLPAGSSRWRLEHRWRDAAGEHRAEEFSTLTDAGRLDRLAAAAGLQLTDRWSDWTGAPLDPYSPMYVSVYRAGPPAARPPLDGPAPGAAHPRRTP